MQHCEHEDRASLYALGLLDESESGGFEHHLRSCSSCAKEVGESRDLAVRLAETIPVSEPPAALRERVLREAMLPRGVVALTRGNQLKWQETAFAGVSVALLYEDPASGGLTSLMRMQPGAHYPGHRHASLEHCYVLEGDLVFEDYTLLAGDYSAGSMGDDHTTATTQKGCLLFIVHNSHDQLHVH